jgi:hypothetical protein
VNCDPGSGLTPAGRTDPDEEVVEGMAWGYEPRDQWVRWGGMMHMPRRGWSVAAGGAASGNEI